MHASMLTEREMATNTQKKAHTLHTCVMICRFHLTVMDQYRFSVVWKQYNSRPTTKHNQTQTFIYETQISHIFIYKFILFRSLRVNSFRRNTVFGAQPPTAKSRNDRNSKKGVSHKSRECEDFRGTIYKVTSPS